MTSIISNMFGGGESSQSSSSQSGFSQLPAEIQEAYKKYATQLSGMLGQNASALALTPAEQSGISSLSSGTAPTATSIASDIAMQANPYNDSVIKAIQRQFTGQGSQLTSAANKAGAMGSNRYQLGANDISNTQAETVGNFLSNQYNTNLQNALTTLPQARANSALAQMQAGSYSRLAPIQAFQQYGSALGILPTSGGSTSTSTENSWNTKGLFG